MSKARSHRKRRSGVQPVLSARSSGLRQVRLQVEQLEDRTLLSTSDAVALSFIDAALPYQAAHVSEYLAYPGDSVLNRISLNAGDMVTASVNTAPYGGGLNSYLRIFEDIGGGNVREIASNDNFRGLDAGLTFQAPNTGVYYVGVSGFDNTAYDPTVPFSGTGMSSGLFDLNLALQAAVAQPNLVASSFQISQANGVWGDSFTVNYALQNRGALDSVPTTLSLLISASNRFDDGVPELQSVSIPTLAAGNSLSGSFTVTLGAAGTPLPPFSDSQQVFLGLGIGSGSPISPTRGNDWSSLKMLKAETIAPGEVLDTLATAKPIAIDSLTSNISLSPGEQKFFAITLTQSGNLKARLDGASGSASLALYDAQGLPIVQSNGQSPSNPSPLLHHVLIGSPDNGGTVYYLQVKNLGSASSIGTLDVLFTPSASKFFTTQVENGNAALVTGDFNGDAQLDLATTYSYYVNSVQVLLGNNDGTFQEPLAYSTQILAEALITGDFTGDGRLDMIVGTSGTNGAQILVGNGDGSFQNATTISSQGGDSLIAGDFNGDGRLDVAASDSYYETFIVLLGLGDGTFQGVPSIVVPGRPTSLEVGDFNDDGRLDVAIAGEYSNQLTVLLGQGDGTFLNSGTFDLGTSPGTVVAGDFNRDGRLDLAAANITSGDVTALLGQGDGTFAVAGTYAIGDRVYSLETSDLNRDGIVDLAVLASGSDTVTVLLGLGDGSFRNAGSFALGAFPLSIVSGDFNGDGRADLAAANYISNTVQVLLGNGDGTFPQIGSPNKTGQLPWTLASGDFNGDGRLDFASANYNSNDVSILLGQGDGTFLAKDRIAAGTGPYSLAVGDFNGDGRLDLVVGNYGSFDVTLLLGSGDGSFQSADTFDVGGIPSAFSVEDYDKDGNPDLAVAIEYDPNRYDGQQVKILLGDGLGSFHSGNTLTVGARPKSLVTGDFNGDGNLDLASANYNSFDLTVLLGDGLGNFLSTTTISLGGAAVAVTAGDFNGDGRVDLAVGTFYSNGITVLLSNGDGTFQDQGFQSVSASLRTLVAGDFNGDGNLDLARTNYLYPSYAPANSVTIMLGDGSGSFQEFDSFSTTSYPQGLIVGDFNGDGRLDLATANRNTAHVTSALGLGNGSFVSPVLAPIVVRSTPLVVTPPGSQVSDIFVLSETGRILFRRGLPTQTGTYAPPVVLNPDPRFAARDLALVSTAGGNFLLAALHSTPTAMAGGPAISQVTLYVPQADGTFTKMPGLDLPAGVLPASIATADLTGDGLGDLVITAGASDQLFVSLQLAPGVFGPAVAYRVGVNPSAIELVDINGDTLIDILVTDRFSGQISVLSNLGSGVFADEERYRAGNGLYGLAPINGTPAVQALEDTNGVVAGSFDNRPGIDLVAINSGTNSFVFLSGQSGGGFLNPQLDQSVILANSPTAIVSGQFTSGDNDLDLAILSRESGTVSIYQGDGFGNFYFISSIEAGNQPSDLTVADVSRPFGGGPDGVQDLLIGNSFGDLLILAGNGDGTFSPYRRVNQGLSLAVANTATPGVSTFFFGNQASDQLSFRSAARGARSVAGASVFQDRSAGIQAPGPQQVVSYNGVQYLVVANSGSNSVLIYTIGLDGQPDLSSKQTYFTGTDPEGLTVTGPTTDLNNDTIPDLVVANQGSNDVSVFLGKIIDGEWTLTYRPRQSSGGLGPTSVAIADVTGADGTGSPDGTPDLLVSNSQSNDVSVLPNRGNGFFINQTITSAPGFQTGNGPQELFVGEFDGNIGIDLVTINSVSNNVTLISNFISAPAISTISSGGLIPTSAIATDIDQDGISDLFVANSGDGAIRLLLGGFNGFEAIDLVVQDPVFHLSDLALVVSGNQVDLYGTDVDREIAVLLGTFGPPLSLPDFLPPGPGFPEGLVILSEGLITTSVTFDSKPASLILARGIGDAARALVADILAANGVNLLALGNGQNIVNDDPLIPFLLFIGDDEAQPNEEAENLPIKKRTWGKAAKIFLFNLEPEPEMAEGQNAPNPQEKIDELFREEPRPNDVLIDLPGKAPISSPLSQIEITSTEVLVQETVSTLTVTQAPVITGPQPEAKILESTSPAHWHWPAFGVATALTGLWCAFPQMVSQLANAVCHPWRIPKLLRKRGCDENGT